MTDELGSRLERPIHFECGLNEPMHIGIRWLHPAAADHSVSISRQQVQRILSFSLQSWAITSFCSWLLYWEKKTERVQRALWELFVLAVWRFSGRGFPYRVGCTHKAALPPVCVAGGHLPCALQHTERAFSLIEHSHVHLFKDDVASGKLDFTGNAVSKQRMAHWIVVAITLVYQAQGVPCLFRLRAHSTRSVASSWALARGASLTNICRAAGWVTPNTFVRFYNLRVEPVSSCVLTSNG